MTAENEEERNEKASICPLSCMGRGKKAPPEDPNNAADPENNAAPTLIEEHYDAAYDLEEPAGYARIQSMMQDTPRSNEDDVDTSGSRFQGEHQAVSGTDINAEVEVSDEDEEEAAVEETLQAESFQPIEASMVYAQVQKPTAPSSPGGEHSTTVAYGLASAPKVADGIPTPRSAGSPPVASSRSAKKVNFDENADRGPSAPTGLDLGAFGDMMQTDADDIEVLKAQKASQEKLLPGVSLNSYGLASMSLEQPPQQPESPMRSHAVDQSAEVHNLKKTIARLTSELSLQLADGEPAEMHKLLPCKGPVPPWLCDSRIFSPLLAAYEDRLQGRAQSADRCETKLQALEQRVQDVVRENERLRVKLRETQVAGPASQGDWDVFTEQARLVLEENQLMIQQLGLQQEKSKQAGKEHATESARLRGRIEELEAENAEAKEEFDRLRAKLHEVKAKYQGAVIDREDQDLLSIDRIKALSRELQEVREQHKLANNELLHQLQSTERERVRLAESLADAVAEKETLRLEVKGLKDLLQSKHRDNLLLQKFAKKHSSLQKYLDSVIHEATNLQNERDSCRAALEAQEKEYGKMAQQLLADIRSQSSVNEAGNKQQNGVQMLQRLIARLLELLKDNDAKREEAEKQVKYMQSLLKEKSHELQAVEAEKRNVDEELEAAWRKAAAAE